MYTAGFLLDKIVFNKSTIEALLIGLAIALTNHVLFVLPIALEIFGDGKVTTIISIISMDGLLLFSVTIIAMDSITNKGETIVDTLKKIAINPPLIGIALGFCISLSKIELSNGVLVFLDQLRKYCFASFTVFFSSNTKQPKVGRLQQISGLIDYY